MKEKFEEKLLMTLLERKLESISVDERSMKS